MPQAFFTLASLAGVRATSYQSKNAPSGRSLIGAGEGTLTPGLVLGKDAL
jgi:hypothetical protein